MPRLTVAVLLLLCALVGAAPGHSQEQETQTADAETAAFFAHFQRLMAGGDRRDIPWRVQVWDARLGSLQRLQTGVRLRVRVRDLQRLALKDALVATAWLGDAGGAWLPGGGTYTRFSLDELTPRSEEVSISFPALVLPGEYTLGVALCDTEGKRCSTTRRELRVRAPRKDPLPQMWRNLPRAQFLGSATDLDLWFHPELKGDLWLPVENDRRLRVEVLANFSSTEQMAGSYRAHYETLGILVQALRVIGDLRIANGSLHITAVDVTRQRVLFQQDDVEELDWPRLRKALDAIHPRVIDVSDLEARTANTSFFRDLLEERLTGSPAGDAGGDGSPGNSPPTPKRIVVVLNTEMLFPRGTDLKRLRLKGECDCRLYYLSLPLRPWYYWDELEKVLPEIKPRKFLIQRPEHFRKALAEMIAEMNRMQ